MKHTSIFLFFLSFCYLSKATALEYEIIIKDHKFTPSILEVEANKKFSLKIINQDDTVEEFDSASLRREKIIPGNSTAKISIPALKSGEYEFIGEFHEETAKGKIKVIE